MQVLDNFLDKQQFDLIHGEITGWKFPWYYQEGKVSKDDGLPSLTHCFFHFSTIESNWFDMLRPIIDKNNMAALTEAYETLLQRLACRSNPVLKVKEVPGAVRGTKTHRPIRCLDPIVQLERGMKRSFEALPGDGFKMFIALVVAREFARNSVAAESLCN